MQPNRSKNKSGGPLQQEWGTLTTRVRNSWSAWNINADPALLAFLTDC